MQNKTSCEIKQRLTKRRNNIRQFKCFLVYPLPSFLHHHLFFSFLLLRPQSPRRGIGRKEISGSSVNNRCSSSSRSSSSSSNCLAMLPQVAYWPFWLSYNISSDVNKPYSKYYQEQEETGQRNDISRTHAFV